MVPPVNLHAAPGREVHHDEVRDGPDEEQVAGKSARHREQRAGRLPALEVRQEQPLPYPLQLAQGLGQGQEPTKGKSTITMSNRTSWRVLH